jgi:ABC-type branched-subunit amino acid transport system ATPase component
MLDVRSIRKTFGGITAVSDVSFDVRRGEILSLIGPNGAGKTTCFNLITGFLKPTSGTIVFTGTGRHLSFGRCSRDGRCGTASRDCAGARPRSSSSSASALG